MPIAALPDYLLKQDLSHASPGMRFGMYLPIWTDRADQEREVRKRAEAKSREGDEIAQVLQRQGMDAAIAALRNREKNRLAGLWEKNDFAARDAWKAIKTLTRADRERMEALAARQFGLAATPISADSLLRLDVLATAPFTTGLGNEHPLENGFAFLNPYGLPYLAGSGIKGVLRQAARELSSGEWGETQGWDAATATALFGRESENGDTDHLRGALIFWDVIPQIVGDSLAVEIMTPHQTHYYQQDPGKGMGSTNPHESGQPTPISFLTVPPKSRFVFHVQCDLAHLRRLAPELAEDGKWKHPLQAAFQHAFQWLGFGAKTAVGYGAMETGEMRKLREQTAQLRAQQERKEAQRQEEERQQAEAQPWPGARLRFNCGNGALAAEKDNRTAFAIRPRGEELLNSLPPEIRKKVLSNQFVKVTAYVSEATLVRVEIP